MTPLGVLPSIALVCREVTEAARAAAQPVRNVWGYASTADHNNRRCVDYMVTEKARGDFVAEYLWAHRERFGLEVLIWHRRIRRTYRKGLIPAGVWAPYRGASAHTDHVHAQCSGRAYRPRSEAHEGRWVVDGGKVDTWLWELNHRGTKVAKRRPGYVVKDGAYVLDVGGRKWLVTSRGNRLALDYLRRP